MEYCYDPADTDNRISRVVVHQKITNRLIAIIVCTAVGLCSTECSSYTVEGSASNLHRFSRLIVQIRKVYSRLVATKALQSDYNA